jgi:alkane 1-monooxygenase
MSSLPYYTMALLSTISLFSTWSSYSKIAFVLIAVVYALFPILDELFSLDERNPTTEERKELERNDGYFRMTLYMAMILSWAANIKLCYIFSTHEITWSDVIPIMGIIFISSNRYSVQFAIAHEVMHKQGRFYRVLATLHMTNLYYTHFTYHHLYRHHQLVSTPLDPSSAPKGQNVYSFIYSCVVNSLKGVY